MSKWSAALPLGLGVLIGLLAAGLLLLVSSRPRGEAVQLLPAPTTPPLTVHISGAVINPGVFMLPRGSRVGDALQAAGGALTEADVEMLNLAAPLEDGARVHVPVKGDTEDPLLKSNEIILPSGGSLPATSGGLVNINTASQAELESLPGIGPALAQRIIEHRQANGPFASIEAIQDVSGIGPGKFEEIKDLITTGG